MVDIEKRGRGRAPAGTLDGRGATLNAARAVFAERGYAAATTREILTRAGTSSPTLHHHFGSKAGLYLAVIHEVIEEILLEFNKAIEGRHRFLDRVDAILDTTVSINRSDPAMSQLLFAAPIEVRQNPELASGSERVGGLAAFIDYLCRTSVDLRMEPVAATQALMTIFNGLGRAAMTLNRRQYKDVVTAVRSVIHGGFAQP